MESHGEKLYEPAGEELDGDEAPANQRELEWRCLSCGERRPPTPGDFMRLLSHRCPKGKMQVRLVDAATGEVKAANPLEAKKAGLLPKQPPEVPLPPGAEQEVTSPQILKDGFFRYTITLPADAFTMFNLARAYNLENEHKSFDAWIWDCIKARFECDYRHQLILAPIGED